MAGRQGFEPRYADPETAVLPLDDLPVPLHYSKHRYIIAVGGAGSSGLPAAPNGIRIITAVSPRIASTPMR